MLVQVVGGGHRNDFIEFFSHLPSVNSQIAQVNRPKILVRIVSGSSPLCSEVFLIHFFSFSNWGLRKFEVFPVWNNEETAAYSRFQEKAEIMNKYRPLLTTCGMCVVKWKSERYWPADLHGLTGIKQSKNGRFISLEARLYKGKPEIPTRKAVVQKRFWKNHWASAAVANNITTWTKSCFGFFGWCGCNFNLLLFVCCCNRSKITINWAIHEENLTFHLTHPSARAFCLAWKALRSLSSRMFSAGSHVLCLQTRQKENHTIHFNAEVRDWHPRKDSDRWGITAWMKAQNEKCRALKLNLKRICWARGKLCDKIQSWNWWKIQLKLLSSISFLYKFVHKNSSLSKLCSPLLLENWSLEWQCFSCRRFFLRLGTQVRQFGRKLNALDDFLCKTLTPIFTKLEFRPH